MKILIQKNEASQHKIRGLKSVFEKLGHNVLTWAPFAKSAFDVFDEFEPDALIYADKTKSMAKCLDERKNRVLTKDVNEIRLSGNTDTSDGKITAGLVCDVGTTSEWCPVNLPQWFRDRPSLNFKVCGERRLTFPQYLGAIEPKNLADFYASSQYFLVFDGKVHDVLLAGGLPVCVGSPPRNFNMKNLYSVDFDYQIEYLLDYFRNDRQGMMARGRETVERSETYWHRASEIFYGWDIDYEGIRTIEVYNATFKL